MRGDFLKTKALFMTFIIIASIFTVYNIKLVTAEEEQPMYCCEETLSGLSCLYTTQDQCDTAHLSSQTSCELTTYCKGGCCMSDSGKCSKNVPKYVCESTEGYTWSDNAECDIPECEKNCCNIANSICSYTTEANCDYIGDDYPEIDPEFVAVDYEYACTSQCTASDQGCCVTDESCIYDTREMCDEPDIDIETGYGFYKETLCSDIDICNCEPHDRKECVMDDVYWFDTCGNQEEVAEDCDYQAGTWCGHDDSGNAKCETTDCVVKREDGIYTFDGIYHYNINAPGDLESLEEKKINKHDGRLGGQRYHGESWCLYESPAGAYLDRPGSQHYRSYCYFGEEYIDPCRDYREEICIQSPYDPTNPQGEAGHATGAACVDNNIYDSPLNTNMSTVPKGNQFWAGDSALTTCTAKNLECQVTFSKKNWAANQWRCVENCDCLSDVWMVNASKWCAGGGDCGANFNILEQYSNDGFYITRAQDYLKTGQDKTMVAYNWDCHYRWHEEGYGVDDMCPKEGVSTACSERGGDPIDNGRCIFYDSLYRASWYTGVEDDILDAPEAEFLLDDRSAYFEYDNPSYTLKNAYGVHGGLLGLSKAMADQLETGVAADWLSDYQSDGLTAALVALGVGAVVGIIVTVVITAAIEAAIAVVAALGVVAGASSSVPVVGWIVAIVVIIIAALIYLFSTGGDTQTVIVSSNCEPWVPLPGGNLCELCDLPISQGGLAIDDGAGNVLPGFECTEYKCKSLGVGCGFISENLGTDREKCFNNVIDEVEAPIMSLNEEIFIEHGYSYTQEGTNGVSVTGIAPYTQFHFGIETNELTQCKISTEPLSLYEEMTEFFPFSYYDRSHNQTRVLTPDEEFTYYIQCQDAAGNPTVAPFQFKIQTEAGEDVQTPVIETTDVAYGTYIAANTEYALVNVYINEPALCKWSFYDQDFELMNYYTLCSGNVYSQSVYSANTCLAALNVTNVGDNQYYFSCMDYSNNTNTQTYPFLLKGTEPLNIDRTSPNGTVYYNDVALQVETSVGAEAGKSVCYYDGIEFFASNASYHEQLLEDLSAGQYSYNVLCQDVAGNQNSTTISFTVDIDMGAPELTEVYQSGTNLYFSLDETSYCEYDILEFEYGSGFSASSLDENTYYFAATEPVYYIICEDVFGNQGSYTIEVEQEEQGEDF